MRPCFTSTSVMKIRERRSRRHFHSSPYWIARCLSLGVIVALLLTLARNVEASSEDGDRVAAWGVLGFAVGITTFATCCEDPTTTTLVGAVVPMSTAAAFALAANKWDLGITAPLTLHGAAASGLTVFLLTGLIEGAAGDDGFEIGPLAWSLGAGGAMLGAYLGATQVGTGEVGTWMGSSYAGLTIGAVGGVGAMVVNIISANDWSTKTNLQVVGWSAAGGLAIGTAISYFGALSGSDDNTNSSGLSASRSTGSIALSPFGLSGTF